MANELAEVEALMLEGFEQASARFAQKIGKSLRAFDRRAQRQQIDAVTNKIGAAGKILAGRGHTDDKIVFSAKAKEERLKRGEQHRKWRRSQLHADACDLAEKLR